MKRRAAFLHFLARPLMTLLALSSLCACSLSPAYVKPDIALPAAYKEDVHWHTASASAAAAAPGDAWWRRFADPDLDRLEARAMAANQSIAAAVADFGSANAIVAQARSATLPSVTATTGASRSRETSAEERENRYTYYPFTAVHAIVAARWEPDIWGQARSRVAAANASSEAVAATVNGVRLSIAAALARAYFDMRASDLDLATLAEQCAQATQLLDMAKDAQAEGLADEDTVDSERNVLDLLMASITNEEARRARDEHAIAALTGGTPASLSIKRVAGYRLPTPDVPAGLPSSLLERRPDIVKAERDAASANAAIGVARAAFFPDLILGADVGGQNSSLAGLLGTPARVWSLGTSLAVSLFDGGTHSARLDQAHKDFDAAASRYRATVLAALQEVEDALATQHGTDQAARHALEVFTRSTQVLERQQAQAQFGLATAASVAHARMDMLDARRRWAQSQAAATQDRITLVLVTGGN
ncbi:MULTISPECIES: efflux transporter outer membrane subunit [unclassified Achromobacter]|uniref:efflux transporter outer membrane subunit n=1 Tax=unclassified Achromobacter TaxID=2626865 RepID=UPI000B51D798|nr:MULTISPECIES: efflux transporter outer membrane subunit [unclassified Achromobacter]OWT79916.1 hypothetical protein CEY05_00350 [Achromobacter sp. HZ34]OWT81800.1 hypothetical protein CEY04_00350 [Achromobacter sp. HZ28]